MSPLGLRFLLLNRSLTFPPQGHNKQGVTCPFKTDHQQQREDSGLEMPRSLKEPIDYGEKKMSFLKALRVSSRERRALLSLHVHFLAEV